MPSLSTIAAAGAAALCAVFAATRLTPPAPPSGHLILQVEGDALTLRITRITAKADPCGLNRVQSDWAIVVRAAGGIELGRVPLDLSMFDLDPAHVGRARAVEGCRVIDTKVAALVNVPHWPDAASLDIVHAGRVVGGMDADAYREMLARRPR